MQEPDDRPDPDALLRRLQQDEARAKRGKLKIFFGFAPGVGKTYRMLQVAHELRDVQKLDVVVGHRGDHRRADTAALVRGSSWCPGAACPIAEGCSRSSTSTRPRAGPRGGAGGRAGAHQRAGLAPPQALAGRGGAAGRRHRRAHHPERAARGEPQRRGGADHARAGARDRARLGARPRGRHRAGGHRAGGAAAAPRRGQGVPAGPSPARLQALLPAGQPALAARAGAAPHGPARGRGRARVPRGARRLDHVARRGAHPGVRGASAQLGAPHPRRGSHGDGPALPLGGGLRGVHGARHDERRGSRAPRGAPARRRVARAAA
jgi:hypothetical protein